MPAMTRDELLNEFLDNNAGQITAARLRDFVHSVKLWDEDHYEHHQTTPAKVWTVNHNLGRKPIVEMYDEQGRAGWAGHTHIDNDTLEWEAAYPCTGTIYCR